MLEFLGVARGHHVKKLNKLLERATEVVGGTLVQSPFYELLGQQVTVHPIGYVTLHPHPFFCATDGIQPNLKLYTQWRVHGPRQHGQNRCNQPRW